MGAASVKLAKEIGAKGYIECSSLLGTNLQQVFNSVIREGIMHRNSHARPPPQPAPCCCTMM